MQYHTHNALTRGLYGYRWDDTRVIRVKEFLSNAGFVPWGYPYNHPDSVKDKIVAVVTLDFKYCLWFAPASSVKRESHGMVLVPPTNPSQMVMAHFDSQSASQRVSQGASPGDWRKDVRQGLELYIPDYVSGFEYGQSGLSLSPCYLGDALPDISNNAKFQLSFYKTYATRAQIKKHDRTLFKAIARAIKKKKSDVTPILETVRTIGSSMGIPIEVTSRVKTIEGVYAWLNKGVKGRNLKSAHDINGIRVLVPTVNDCYNFLDRFSYWFYPRWVVDRIIRPKVNGYQGLMVRVEDGRIFDSVGIESPIKSLEVQIMTPGMLAQNERGSASDYRRNYPRRTDGSQETAP